MYQISDFVDNLKSIMIEKGLNAAELEKEANLSHAIVSSWLRYTNIWPQISNIIKLANYFECSIDYLLGRTENPNYLPAQSSQNFNIILAKLMKEKKKTTYSLAKDLHIYDSQISHWRKDKMPNLPYLVILADYFNCSLDYLVGRSDLK